MGLFDFFFPDTAQAKHTGRLADAQERAGRLHDHQAVALNAQNRQLRQQVARLEQDVGALALVVASILKRLDEKGHVTRDEVKETIQKLDLLDKVRDGKISIEDLGAGDFFDTP
jgi:hypothetical protein